MSNLHGRYHEKLKTQTALESALTHTRFEEENATIIIFGDLNPS